MDVGRVRTVSGAAALLVGVAVLVVSPAPVVAPPAEIVWLGGVLVNGCIRTGWRLA